MRSEELSARHPLEAVRRRLQQERRGQTVALGRLSEDDVRRLATKLLPSELATPQACARIFLAANGHPLFAMQLLRYCLDTGTMPGERDPLETIGEAVLRRLECLSEDARGIAEIAATIEGAFTVEELGRISGWEEARVFDAVGALLDAKIVGERGGERHAYAFTHALIEGAVRDGVRATNQRSRHRRIAAVLEETRGDDEVCAALVATHWQAAGEPRRAARSRVRAANGAIERYARQDAIAHARQAIALGLDDVDRFAALSLVVRASQGLGGNSADLQDIGEMERLAEGLGDEQRFAALSSRLQASTFLPFEKQYEAGERLVALARASERDDWMAEAHVVRGMALAIAGRFEEAEATVGAGLAIARRAANPALTFRALKIFFQILLWRGKVEAVLPELEAMEREFAGGGDHRALVPLAHAYMRLAVATEYSVPEYCKKARAFATLAGETDGDVQTQLSAQCDLAYGAFLTWDVARVRADYHEVIRRAQELGLTHYRIVALNALCNVELEVGRVDRALTFSGEARTILQRHPFDTALCANSLGFSETSLACGRVAIAVREGRIAFELASKFDAPPLVAETLLALGAAEYAGGDVAAGLKRMRRCVDIERLGSPRPLVHALSVLLESLLGAGELDEARAIATELSALYCTSPNHQRYPGLAALALAREAASRCDGPEELRMRLLGRRSIEYVVARLNDPDDRTAFTAMPHNRELLR
jgi:hypothetical protein